MNENIKGIYHLLQESFPGLPMKFNVPWKELATLGVGRNLPILAEPADDISLLHIVRHCAENGIPLRVLGGGSNMVGSESPFEGLVVRLCQNDFIRIRASRAHVTAGAGVRLRDLCVYSAHQGFGGIAPLAGIPGTVGGALRMNAGVAGVTISSYLTEVCGFDPRGTVWSSEANEIAWGYRSSSIPADVIVTAAIFRLDKVEMDAELERVKEHLEQRRQKEPKGRSAGCVFRNPQNGDPAGKLIDECGCKGMAVGDFRVSEAHANYIINTGDGHLEDFIKLAAQIRRVVRERKGVELEPEVTFFNPADHQALMEN